MNKKKKNIYIHKINISLVHTRNDNISDKNNIIPDYNIIPSSF